MSSLESRIGELIGDTCGICDHEDFNKLFEKSCEGRYRYFLVDIASLSKLTRTTIILTEFVNRGDGNICFRVAANKTLRDMKNVLQTLEKYFSEEFFQEEKKIKMKSLEDKIVEILGNVEHFEISSIFKKLYTKFFNTYSLNRHSNIKDLEFTVEKLGYFKDICLSLQEKACVSVKKKTLRYMRYLTDWE